MSTLIGWSVALTLLSGAAAAQDFGTMVPGATASAPEGTGAPRSSRPAATAPPSAPTPSPGPRVLPEKAPPPPIERPPSAAVAAPVVVHTTLDRTATWIGDPVTYVIEIVCPPGSDILQADISRDRLRLVGLEVRDASSRRDTSADGTITYRATFSLVGYADDRTIATIEPQSVRYYVHTAGQPPETLTPADEIAIAPSVIAIRSVLPDANVTWLRDQPTSAPLPEWLALARPVGFAAMLLALVPIVVGLVGFARRARRREIGTVKTRVRQRVAAFEALANGADVTDVAGRRDALARLNAAIRERLTHDGIPALGLTPDELERTLQERGSRRPVDEIVSILRACECALYAPAAMMPDAAAASGAIESGVRLFGGKAR